MKNFVILFISLMPFTFFAQTTVKATTEDGKGVILKSDNTWEYDSEKTVQRKITLEFTCKDKDKQFQVIYDAPDTKLVDTQHQMSGFQRSGWKQSFYVNQNKMENQISLQVAIVGVGSEKVTLNLYVDDKLVKTTTEKAKNIMSGPASLRIDLADYK